MSHRRFRLIKLINLTWIATVMVGLVIAGAAPAPAEPGEWDPTLPAIVSAGAPGDPLAVANASLQATAQATQTTLDLGRQFLSGLGINVGGGNSPASSAAGANASGSRIPRANAPQAIEYVIRRAGSQMGVPYSWGGGTLEGPSKGVDSGAGTVGFDCSGLMRYAFAGVGVLIPRFSGDQYNAGKHVPPSAARRGDLIFYGPGGSQHVALYLGNGQMLEASGSAGKVTVSPVRKSGMTPFLTRIIDY
ncbi:NlpC/P60 family peptidoglycan endopeptidase RipB [Mycobacterium shinjukuense]|uniref:Peptidoglycan endopeptidase RipB n=1 Tax=Mycobacterium shinjukuense TaxID=398694 RepID=A0A7I7MNV3_9MYCO|nr:NlpC/P60 family peptidoglycan endopeptidase RipB [Mycobacterium shinjukuense]MCV6987635.1 NlpC/P60 family peptidoglycan endopeptidase RipB [Mycobacterium shinjukuense]ORB67354.1 peptidase C40 [Mycobacterium shinjukuense]BBX73825.1 peptidoglycan endopeptidase RipB [Mycobacterium shinjukuense]